MHRVVMIRWSLLVALGCLLMLGLQGWGEWGRRSARVLEAETSMLNLASSLTQQVDDTIDIADIAVIGVVKQLEANGTSAAAASRLEQILRAQKDEMPRLRDITVIGNDGGWLATSLPATSQNVGSRPVKAENLSDRVYFRRHRDDPNLGLFISPPIKSSISGKWVVTVSRRFKSADGGFGGVVFAIINLSDFTSSYATYDLGPDSSIALASTDGTLLARYPPSEAFIGQNAPNATVYERLREHSAGSFVNTSVVDGVRRFSGYRRSDRYPLVVVAAVSADHALAAWRGAMLIHMLIALVLSAGLALLGLRLNWQVRRFEAAEQAFRKTEAFLDRAGHHAGVGSWEMDLVTNHIYWSPETCRIFGVELGYQPTAETAITFYRAEARPVINAAVARCAADGSGWDLEMPCTRADGRPIWVRVVGSMAWADGKPTRLIGAFQDVTDRVGTRLALQVANDRVALAIDSAGIGIWDWDITRDEMVWDARMYQLLGMQTPNEMVTYALWKRRVHPDDLAAAEQAVQEALVGSKPYSPEFRVVWDDGSVRHIRGAGQVTRDEAGSPIRMTGSNWDVTELVKQNRLRERADREAAAATALYRLLSDNSTDMIFIIDRQRMRRYVSPASRDLLGYTPEELTGASPLQVIHPDDAEQVQGILTEMYAGRERAASTQRTRHKDGHWVWTDAVFKLMRDPESGAPFEICGSLRDVSHRVAAESAMRESLGAVG